MATHHDDEPPRRSLASRVVRFPIKVVVLILVLLLRPFVRHPKISAVAVVALGVLAYAGYAVYLAPAQQQAASVASRAQSATPDPRGAASPSGAAASTDASGPRVTTQSPVPSPEAPIAYIRAMSNYDAHTMWLQLSPDAQGSQGSEQALQQRLDNMKPRPGTVKEITYVGGSKMHDGTSVYMYVLTVQNGTQVDQTELTVYLDQNGKITSLQ